MNHCSKQVLGHLSATCCCSVCSSTLEMVPSLSLILLVTYHSAIVPLDIMDNVIVALRFSRLVISRCSDSESSKVLSLLGFDVEFVPQLAEVILVSSCSFSVCG